MASPTPLPVQLSAATRALAQRSDVDALTAAVASAVTAEVYVGHTRDPAFLAALNRSVRDNVTAALGLFAGTSTLADIRPPAAFALTDMLAELGIPVSEVERSYWVGMSRFWQEWFTLARGAAEAGEGTVEEFVGPPTELMFKYLIDVVALVVARHDAVSAEIRRSRDDKRRALLTQMVDGSLTEATEEVERSLGYRLSGSHLAVELQAAGRREAERLTGELASALDARGSLLLRQGAGTWLIWLGLRGEPGPDTFECIEAIARANAAKLCVGEAGVGLSGFLQSRHDALEVAGLRGQMDSPPPVLRYRDVRLEVLLSKDERSARRFVTEELGGLGGDGERVERARDTLLDWLTTGSAAQTATRMGVHENTIRARLAHAEVLLPHDVRSRRAEVLAALRLRAMVGDPPL